VTRDIPALLNAFARRYPGVRVHRAPGLAGEEALLDAACDRLAAAMGGADGRDSLLLVVGRGTADSAANATVATAAEALRTRLGFAHAAAAFADLAEPGVEGALAAAAGRHARVVVLPWFLTTGVLVKRLAKQVAAAAAGRPGTTFLTAGHLGPHPRVIDALAQRARAGADHPAPTMARVPLVLGVGCESGATPEALEALVRGALDGAGLDAADIRCVATLEARAAHAAVGALARRLGVPVEGFAAAALERETPRLANPSEAVFRAVGCHGVAEGAALAAAGPGSRLVLPKAKGPGVTCAVAAAGGAP